MISFIYKKTKTFFPLFLGILFTLGGTAKAQSDSATYQKNLTYQQITVKSEKNISLKFKQKPIAEALEAIAKKVDAGLYFNTSWLPEKTISLALKNVTLGEALRAVLKGTGLEAYASGRNILLRKKEIKNKPVLPAVQQETITGTVTDAQSGETLPGVNILVKGTSIGTSTDSEGNFELTVESLQDTLVVSYIGYQTQEVPIQGRITIDITLNVTTGELEEMVVVGFGTQSRKEIVGSVSSVDSEALQKVHTATLDQNLQGMTAGVQVTSTSGQLGSPVSVRIRGTSSINASSQPLYVLDGMPLTNNAIGVSDGLNPLLNLNSEDVESIEVLKDASAAAIYGSRAANGVVLITTKEGKAGQPKLSINMSAGYSNPTDQYELLNTSEFIEMHNYRFDSNLNPDDYANTDWQDLVTRTGAVENYNVSLTGGNEDTQYFMSSLYSDEKGFSQPNRLTKYSARAKVNHRFNDRLDLNLSLSPSRSLTNQLPSIGLVAHPYTMSMLEPPMVPQYLPNGELNDGRDSSHPGNSFSGFAGTPYTDIVGINIRTITTQIVGNAGGAFDIKPNLTVESSFNFQSLQSKTTQRNQNNTSSGYPLGSASANSQDILNYSWNNTVNYQYDVADHSIEATLGITFERNEQRSFDVSGQDIPFNTLETLNSAAQISGGGGFEDSYAFQNNLVRISYSFKDSYMLTLTGSYNGTSRFSKESRYGFFPAVAAGWIISEENFLNELEALSFLKLRVSYGVTGNASVGNFAYLGLLNSGSDYFNQPGLGISQLTNPSLSWEQVKQLDIGLEYSFFNERISGSLGYYNKQTTDLLLNVPVSNTNAFTTITRNSGKMLNEGFEFDISTDILTNQFLWSINANISTLHNEVQELVAGEIIDDENIVREGEAVGSFYIPEYKGINPENGDALFADGDGGTTSNYNEAPRKILGSPHPDFFGGFGTNLSYKGFDANINFQFTYGNEMYWSEGRYLASNMSVQYNQLTEQLDYWTPNNTDASVPEPRVTANGNGPSSRYLQDGSYLRLKSMELGYTIPSNFLGVNKIRLYVQGTNILTITDYKGLDPEATGSATANILQSNVNFEPPQSRTIIGGVQINI